jgi:hypothetical protein
VIRAARIGFVLCVGVSCVVVFPACPTDLQAADSSQQDVARESARQILKVFVADVDAHSVCAPDATDGHQIWRNTTGGKLAEYKLDAPPAWDSMAVANGRL